jgi:hypothetical protein
MNEGEWRAFVAELRLLAMEECEKLGEHQTRD